MGRPTQLVLSLGLLALAACSSCAGGPKLEEEKPPPPRQGEAYVSPAGSDDGPGTRDRPFRTLRRALETDYATVHLLPGEHLEPELTIGRQVALRGPEDRSARVAAHVFVRAHDVTLQHLEVAGGLTAHRARRLLVESSSIAAGEREDTVSLTSSQATLRRVALSCGFETCVQVTTSTASLEGLRVRSEVATKRGVRAETSSVTASDLDIAGMGISQLQASSGARLTVRRSRLHGSQGSGLVALQDAVVQADEVEVEGAARMSLLVQGAEVRFARGRLGGTRSVTVGVAGARVELVDSWLGTSPEGALSASVHAGRPPEVSLSGGRVEHGPRDGVLIGSGRLRVQGTTFVGGAGTGEGGDAITATGLGTELEVRGARIEQSRGYGVVIVNDASGTVTATISAPRLGGILVENALAEPSRVVGSFVEDCTQGSGIMVLGSEATIERTRVSGCFDAGLLAGQGGRATARRVEVSDNPRYGFAAFGGATLTLESSRARGSGWAAFATCGDGASIIDAGDNTLEGATSLCP